MCDTLCARTTTGMLFAKNSDRPPGEPQVIEAHGERSSGGVLHTQYLQLGDAGAAATVLSRPTWLWGVEHGVNEHRVAIGNEKVYTVDDPHDAPAALIGMDLVRLGLERARHADEALETIVGLIAEHGQGGVGDSRWDEPYFSSFLIADPTSAWILETSGETWAARAVPGGAAISNRLTLRHDWDRASPDVKPGIDFDRWRNPDIGTGHADRRLAASRAVLAGGASSDGDGELDAARLVAHLRDHGTGPWGAPVYGGFGEHGGPVVPLPTELLPDGTGVTVCMHVRGFQATTSSMVAELPASPDAPLRAWVALGSPCASVFVPVFPPSAVPTELSSEELWRRFANLRDRVEADDDALGAVRQVLGPLEAELWAEADAIAAEPGRWDAYIASVGPRLVEALSMAES